MDAKKSVGLTYARAVHRYLMDLETANRSPKTMKWYRQKLDQLGRATGAEQLRDLGRDSLLDFIAGLRSENRSPAYIRGWYQVFRGFIGWAREQGYVVDESLVNERGRSWFTLKKPTEVEMPVTIFSTEDLERIYEAAGGKRDEVLCKVLAGTGLRLSEALNLTIEDLQDDRVRVRWGKGRKSRSVPLSRQLQRELNRFVERTRPDTESDRLFLSNRGTPLTESAATAVMKRLRAQTGLHVHAHAFRHTYATNYLRNGGEIERLRRILGHTSYRIVARYVHLAGADLGRGIDELSPY